MGSLSALRAAFGREAFAADSGLHDQAEALSGLR
jgi:hypothetical protein